MRTIYKVVLIGILTSMVSACSTQVQNDPVGAVVKKPVVRKPVKRDCHRHYSKWHCHKAGHSHKGLDKRHTINRRVQKYRKSITR